MRVRNALLELLLLETNSVGEANVKHEGNVDEPVPVQEAVFLAAACTVRAAEFSMLPMVAVMVAVPCATASAKPAVVVLRVAAAVLLEVHVAEAVTLLVELSVKVPVAVN